MLTVTEAGLSIFNPHIFDKSSTDQKSQLFIYYLYLSLKNFDIKNKQLILKFKNIPFIQW